MGGNKLKERFLAAPAFDAVYAQAYRELYASMYSSGTTLAALERITGQAQAVTSDRDGVAAKAEQLRTTITNRAKSLATDPVVTGGAAPAS
jgi:spore coat protein CotH